MKDSLIVRLRGRERTRKTIGRVIKDDLEVSSLPLDQIHNNTLWHRVIHVADLTYWGLGVIVLILFLI